MHYFYSFTQYDYNNNIIIRRIILICDNILILVIGLKGNWNMQLDLNIQFKAKYLQVNTIDGRLTLKKYDTHS